MSHTTCNDLRNADAGDNPYAGEDPIGWAEVCEKDGLLCVPRVEYRRPSHPPRTPNPHEQPKSPRSYVRRTLCGKPLTLGPDRRIPKYGLPTCPECKRLNDLQREDVAAFIEWSRRN